MGKIFVLKDLWFIDNLNIYELLDLQARKCFWNAPWAANQYKIAIFY